VFAQVTHWKNHYADGPVEVSKEGVDWRWPRPASPDSSDGEDPHAAAQNKTPAANDKQPLGTSSLAAVKEAASSSKSKVAMGTSPLAGVKESASSSKSKVARTPADDDKKLPGTSPLAAVNPSKSKVAVVTHPNLRPS